MVIKWFTCPICGKRLFKYDINKSIIKGLYFKCKGCKEELNIELEPKISASTKRC